MRKFQFLGLLSTVFLMTACEKVINIPESNALAGDIALKTVQDNEQGIIGAYASLGIEMDILLNATFADEVRTVGEFYNAATTHEWLYGSQDVGIRDNFTAMGPNYQIADRVNRVLRVLPTADSTRLGDETLRRRLRGEALFLRAWAHFNLYQYYCQNYTPDGLAMPYMEAPSLGAVARTTQQDYFQRLTRDINEAKTLLPNNLTDINRATVAAANGLHARIALYQRDWATAESNATAYINAVPLSTRASFPGIWTDANTQEVAFRLIRNVQVGPRMGSLFRGISANVGGAPRLGTITWGPSNKIWDSYDQTNDIRFSSYFIDEPLLQVESRPSRLIRKYAGGAYTTATENITNAKVLRTAEMLLIRAEARAEQGRFSGANSAEADINTLRAARIDGYTPVTFASAAQAITAVMDERFKELCYEGHRFFDLRRRNLPVQRLASDAPTANAVTLPVGNFRFILPIPLREMEANKLMVQNPGF